MVFTLTGSSNGIPEKKDRKFIDQMLSLKRERGCSLCTARGRREISNPVVETVEDLVFSSWIDGLHI
jgi:hypothetical protein